MSHSSMLKQKEQNKNQKLKIFQINEEKMIKKNSCTLWAAVCVGHLLAHIVINDFKNLIILLKFPVTSMNLPSFSKMLDCEMYESK